MMHMLHVPLLFLPLSLVPYALTTAARVVLAIHIAYMLSINIKSLLKQSVAKCLKGY